MVLLVRWEQVTWNPQIDGQNWVYMRKHRTTACTANAKSLKRTVDSSEVEYRAAYCAWMVGEYRKLAV